MARRQVESQEMIAQSLLAAYLENTEERRRADAAHKRIRAVLLRRYDAGAEHEPGRLVLDVTESDRLFFSWRKLCETLGEDEVTRLAGMIPRTRVRRIEISARGVPGQNGTIWYG